MGKGDWIFFIGISLALSIFITSFILTRPHYDREVYIGEITDIRFSGNTSNQFECTTTFVFENGSVVPVRGIKKGVAIGDNIILIVRGTGLSELVINPDNLGVGR